MKVLVDINGGSGAQNFGFFDKQAKIGKNQNFEKSPCTYFDFTLKYHVSKFQVDTIKIDENNTQRACLR